ncbi:hypothetical protein NBRC116585_15850 [Thalassolituus maritimus]|uniref:Uncharacterized protein n=1 Tax=Thalassolituus maritimus TaxID=484498 RepID=A0ABP9ZZ83_9GAMM
MGTSTEDCSVFRSGCTGVAVAEEDKGALTPISCRTSGFAFELTIRIAAITITANMPNNTRDTENRALFDEAVLVDDVCSARAA